MKNLLPERMKRPLRTARDRARTRLRARTAPSVPLSHVVIGVGAQKAATTWLAEMLSQHPDIYIRHKEVHYWDTVRYPYIAWGRFGDILAQPNKPPESPFGSTPFDHSRYLGSLNYGRRDERIVADVTPSYALCRTETFRDMKAVHEDVRFVLLMRDPVDRMWSGLRQKLRPMLKANPQFDGLDRMMREACTNPHDQDLGRSRYDETLEALDAAGCNTCAMFYETLFTGESVAELAAFIGVDGLPDRTGRRTYAGEGANLTMKPETRALAREALADTYSYIAKRYGARVPANWTATATVSESA